jgi:hypothetical protein
MNAKRSGTLEVYLTAGVSNVETDERITDRSILALCHGAGEETHLEGSLDLSGLPVLPLPVPARVVFDEATGSLEVMLAFSVAREPTERETEVVYARLYEALHRAWGTNYDFEVAGLAEDLTVFFHAEPVRTKFTSGA